jgi:hypothetical protein
MKLSKPKDWGRILLPSFLLIILIQGLMLLPELRVGFFPEKVWGARLCAITKECGQVNESLILLQADLARLNYLSGSGFPSGRNSNGNRRGLYLSQVFINTWHSIMAPTDLYIFERNFYLARKKFFHTEIKLSNLQLMLDNLAFSIKTHRIDGSPYFGNHNTELLQKQLQVLRQDCQQYASQLNIQAKRLKQFRMHMDNEEIFH